MGYFNYFIKCVIRKLAYKVTRPKVLLTVLLSVLILLVLHNTGYCTDEWSQDDINAVLDGLATITSNQETSITLLSSVGVDVSALKSELEFIQNQITSLYKNQVSIINKITELNNLIDTLNTNILNIYNKLDTNQKQLIDVIEKNNAEVVDLLKDLKKYLAGDSVEFSQEYTTVSNMNMSSNAFTTSDWTNVLFFKYDKKYTYVINVSRSASGNEFNCIVGGGFSTPNLNTSYSYINSHSINANETYKFTVNSGLNFDYIYIRSFAGLTVSIQANNEQSGLNGLNNSINQGNQLQQEQNDFLKNDDINTDLSTLPSDNTQDITNDGFNGIFQQLYTTFTSGTAQDVVITIPFTNKSFTINANTVYGGADLGFIKTLIQTFWYFVISYFIVQDIGKKINKIKSGDIEHVQETNIKEDIL